MGRPDEDDVNVMEAIREGRHADDIMHIVTRIEDEIHMHWSLMNTLKGETHGQSHSS